MGLAPSGYVKKWGNGFVAKCLSQFFHSLGVCLLLSERYCVLLQAAGDCDDLCKLMLFAL